MLQQQGAGKAEPACLGCQNQHGLLSSAFRNTNQLHQGTVACYRYRKGSLPQGRAGHDMLLLPFHVRYG